MTLLCKRCGYTWTPHSREGQPNDPKACPSCKSYQWRKEPRQK